MIRRFYIEITSTCNLSCPFCHKNSRPPRRISADEFEHIVSMVSEVTRYIYLHVQGEPLTHPRLNQFLMIAEKYGCHVQLVTNALLLKEHMDLLEYPSLRKISFSLQSVEAHAMPVAELMEPVFTFIEKASEQGRPYCELRFWRDDQMEQQRTEECLRMIRSRYTASDSGREKNEKILPGVYVDFSNPFEWPDTAGPSDETRGTCLGGIDQLAVLSDGTVVPCCLDEDGKIPLGNLFDSTLKEILNSERYINFADGMRRHELSEELCRRCTFRKRFDRKL